MSGINSIMGINQVGVDYRPEPGQVGNASKSAVANEPQQLEGVNDVGAILRRLDVLLINAAQRSVATNIESKTRLALSEKVGEKNGAEGRTLVELGILTAEESAAIQELARNAAAKLRALDKFSGSDLALAVGGNRRFGGVFGWRKASDEKLTAVAAAVKAAVDAQNDLSQGLRALNRRLAKNEQVDAALYDQCVELQLQCDRRGTEINSIVLRMHELAVEDSKNGGRSDPRIKELLNARFQELMPREAIMMHGTADALELMRKSLDSQISPLLEKLDAFSRDHAKVLTKQELLDLQSYMKTARDAVKEVSRNGIVIDNARYDIDKSLLQKLDEVLDIASVKLDIAFSTYGENMLNAFCAEVKASLLPEGPGKDRLEASSPDSLLGKYVALSKEFVEELSSCAYGSMTADELCERASEFADRAAAVGQNFHMLFMQRGYDEKTAIKMYRTFKSFRLIAAQFAELKKGTDALKGAGDALVTSGDVRRMLLGELGVSSVVEASTRGFKASDANSEADDANIVASKPLGAGNAASAYLVTTKGGGQYVFKPELEGRIGLGVLTLGQFDAYSERQSATNLNLATQDAANMLGCGDLVVKYFVGSHKGQFGMFMEKASGASGRDLRRRAAVNGDNSISPDKLLTEVTDEARRDKIKCQIARQLNRLQWLDVITGQGDRHWNNYFVHIDKDTDEVKLKAIDNDASFSGERIGVQKYRLSRRRAAFFEGNLVSACADIHGGGHARTEAARCMNSPAIVKNPDGTVTIDLSKMGRMREIGVALSMSFGMHSIGFPDAIDEDFYNHLIELDNDPKAKSDFLAALKPRLSKRAFDATEMRLNDAIAYAKRLAGKNRVFTADDWKSPAKVGTLGKIPFGFKIPNRANVGVDMTENTSEGVRDYLINCCTSYYGRDCMDTLFT